MDFVKGKFIKRYKRFLVDVELEDGSVVTAHCTNTGSLRSCLVENAPVLLSPVDNPKRKTRFTWEMIKINGSWVGINTSRANEIAYNVLKDNILPQFSGLLTVRREVKFGDSRFDIYCRSEEGEIFIEVKNVTYKKGDYALFPDAPTKRGQKHITDLLKAQEAGYRVALFFIIQRTDVKRFAPAREIDPLYSEMLINAVKQGLEVYPLQIEVSPQGERFVGLLPFDMEEN